MSRKSLLRAIVADRLARRVTNPFLARRLNAMVSK
jgi:hypothetical protein